MSKYKESKTGKIHIMRGEFSKQAGIVLYHPWFAKCGTYPFEFREAWASVCNPDKSKICKNCLKSLKNE